MVSGDSCGCKEPVCQSRRPNRCGCNPWVEKIPWSRKWQPTPVLLPGKSHGQRSLVGYSLMRSQRVGLNLVSTQTRTHTHACTVISKTHSQAKLNYLEVKNSFNIFIGLKKMYIFVLENLKYLFLTLYKKKLPNSWFRIKF